MNTAVQVYQAVNGHSIALTPKRAFDVETILGSIIHGYAV